VGAFVRRVGRIDAAGAGWPAAALRPSSRPAIARQPNRAATPGDAELWSEPLIPVEIDFDDDRPRRRREEPGRWWGATMLRRFSPVDVLLALSVVVLLAAMIVVAIALTNHV
jgi:hypothetical protein